MRLVLKVHDQTNHNEKLKATVGIADMGSPFCPLLTFSFYLLDLLNSCCHSTMRNFTLECSCFWLSRQIINVNKGIFHLDGFQLEVEMFGQFKGGCRAFVILYTIGELFPFEIISLPRCRENCNCLNGL